MTTSKIKFKLSLEKISFEFEGDRETAERITGGINRTLDGIRSAPDTVLGIENRATSAPVVDVAPSTKRRRRRSTPSSVTVNDEGGNGTGSVVAQRLVQLRQQRFFDEPRMLKDILDRLKTLGFNHRSNDISKPLLKLTQDGVLTREQNKEKKQWQYTSAGP